MKQTPSSKNNAMYDGLIIKEIIG